jgi:Tfp pilus assembly protein PilF
LFNLPGFAHQVEINSMKSVDVFKLSACILIVAANLAEPTHSQDSVAARQQLAREGALKGDYASAEKYLRDAIALDAGNFTAHNNLGNVLFLQGKLDSAEASYARALPLSKTKDDSLGVRFNLGTLLLAATDDSLNALAEKIAGRLRDGNEVDRFEGLIGQQLDGGNSAKTGDKMTQNVSTFDMKKLMLAANNSSKKKRGNRRRERKQNRRDKKGR